MKKKLLVLMIALVICSTLSAFDFYDKNGTTMGMDGRIRLKVGTAGFEDITMSNQSSRIGFIGTKIISDGVKATGHIEWGFDPVNGVNELDLKLTNRLGYIRFDIKDHQLTVGQQNGAWKKVVDWTDMYEVYGADSHNVSANYGTGRAPALQYNLNLKGFELTANAQVKNAHNQWSSGAALTADLVKDSITLGAAVQYVSELAYNLGGTPTTSNPFLIAGGINWISEIGITTALTASYHMETIDGDGFGFESYISYELGDSGHDIYAGNNYQSLDRSTVNYIDIGARYRILPGSSLYAFTEAKIDLEDSDNNSALWLGTRYSF